MGKKDQSSEVALTSQDQFAIMETDMDVSDEIMQNLGVGGITMHDLPKVTVPTGGSTVWSVPDIEAEGGESNPKDITGVIIMTRTTRQYWKTSFEDGGGTPPDCSSDDGLTGVGDPGGDCTNCPLNEFESHTDGKRKACAEKRLIFITTQRDILPTIVVAPAGSLGNVRKFLVGLTSKRLPVFSVYSKLTLEKDKNDQNIAFSRIVIQKIADVEDMVRARAYADAIKPYLQKVSRDFAAGTAKAPTDDK